MRPQDLPLLRTLGDLAFHGDLLLTGISRPDVEKNAYLSRIERVPLDGGEPVAWTGGERDIAPRISPDGRLVAFSRSCPGERAQLFVMPVDGGEARQITSLVGGAGNPVWSPDSRRIAFVARVAEKGRYGTEEGIDAAAEAPRHITRLQYRIDGPGFLTDQPKRLFVVEALEAGAEPTMLTEGEFEVDSPAWTPDGTALVVVAERGLGRVDTQHTDLYLVPVAGGEPTPVVRSTGSVTHPTVTPDGKLFYLGTEHGETDSVARNGGLFLASLPTDGSTVEGRRLTDVETVHLDHGCAPAPVPGGALVVVNERGSSRLRFVPDDAVHAELASLTALTPERENVRAFAVHGGRVAVLRAAADGPGEVVLLDWDGAVAGEPRTLTDYNRAIRDLGVRPARELIGTGPDGYPLHGWLVLPEGEGPHPVLLLVHGGPFASYEWSFFDEAQVYAAAGYAVVMSNPRGSAGYGQRHGRAVVEAMGTVDVSDILALLDIGLAEPECDASRVGVMGGSYGGFMTSWLAAHHGERFVAAWSERAVNAWDSFHGSSDIGWFFTEAYLGPDPVVWREKSPLYHAHRIEIPFAVVHSEQDWRCPLEQAQRQFVALKRSGVDVEMLIFPGEGHELSRSGQPRHRVQRFEAALDFWNRRLPV
ncbi:S9 family peptidase [Actinoalloteichus hymeniacidonis]|uniref:Dipeptidyl aminopeptidase/acylaminoacyl peptidase n=1 Tax=Actinoalloteichus hymeniacidonis TaxID=340345 RepID=A0AAC9HP48_9PSEU|nr:S9 family peptidase [Actinoalloteichus hymeniacidonis]AOS62875.1 dipeptidyl aminopeptidase/acylaminoacyl peptidase [Actinoalloteichus hymeniacidonis]MBB5909092.1 dipeptidyl aminopeptidase/acylaminoacyl peptidase [Actinoalloteichus hymeniacidonis]